VKKVHLNASLSVPRKHLQEISGILLFLITNHKISFMQRIPPFLEPYKRTPEMHKKPTLMAVKIYLLSNRVVPRFENFAANMQRE